MHCGFLATSDNRTAAFPCGCNHTTSWLAIAARFLRPWQSCCRPSHSRGAVSPSQVAVRLPPGRQPWHLPHGGPSPTLSFVLDAWSNIAASLVRVATCCMKIGENGLLLYSGQQEITGERRCHGQSLLWPRRMTVGRARNVLSSASLASRGQLAVCCRISISEFNCVSRSLNCRNSPDATTGVNLVGI